jgi:hypothetical protein
MQKSVSSSSTVFLFSVLLLANAIRAATEKKEKIPITQQQREDKRREWKNGSFLCFKSGAPLDCEEQKKQYEEDKTSASREKRKVKRRV